ncbi:nucleotidyltransferase domain-containing protein [Orbus wheelerorum]|uniref:nucleotidyltransferase domain-containing protein n=1 Tax=Orbus wheelerorum TaxID=3074111 RepID=UPI00370D2DE8
MQNRIKQQLRDIELQHQITILYACESGSRAWGFPSPNSDYDVRFIYVHPRNKYLSIDDPAAQLTFPINDELDFHGWDLKKTLQLIRKSNTTPFEWLQSPIIYQQHPAISASLWALCQHYFNARGNIYHYLGIAKSALQTGDGLQIGIKKLFYVLRPLLSAKWCLEKQQIAPMAIAPLMALLPKQLQDNINTLIKYKSTVEESYSIDIEPLILDFIDQTASELNTKVQLIDEVRFDSKLLDDFFLNVLTSETTK